MGENGRVNCLPQSGGCERPFTDAFVAHLNVTGESHFRHRACLDVEVRTSAQPEALYQDEKSNASLVIERKSIVWPTDYIYRHRNDHVVSDVILSELEGLEMKDLYVLRLPMLIKGREKELRNFAEQAGKAIRKNWKNIAAGTRYKGGEGEWWWRFGKAWDGEFEDGAPKQGITVSWIGPSLTFDDFIDPVLPPKELVEKLRSMFANCADKFSGYPYARRILVIDPVGDLRSKNRDFWEALWKHYSPPPEIGEIWSGICDWVTDTEQDWIFEPLYEGA
jgi:hypothetical protein